MKHYLFAVLFLFSAAHADPVCSIQHFRVDTAYPLEGKSFEILQSPMPLDRNKNLNVMVQIARVKKNISDNRKDLDAKTVEGLANTIVRAAYFVGVDFSVLASIIRKESFYCMAKHNEKGGDSGCSQFTSIALLELKQQFGTAKAQALSPGVLEVLLKMAKGHFGKSRLPAFEAWIKSPISKQLLALRKGGFGDDDIFDIDIFAGAVLLKIVLAATNGNYVEAVRRYNGSALKNEYQIDVDGWARNINFETNSCEEVKDVLEGACEVSGDQGCALENQLRA